MTDRPEPSGAERNPLVPEEFAASLDRVRSLLDRLVVTAEEVADPSAADDAATLRRTLEEPFLLVIVGEVKSGKSTFINVLLGRDVCAVGPTPLTDRIHVLQYGDEERETEPEPFLVERTLDVPLLQQTCIVDTPGTNSILREHGEITERFVPRADLVLFLTSIDRPYSESENRFLSTIADRWRKNVLFVVTKIDGRSAEDVRAVVEYVANSCEEHHGFRPPVFPLSARQQQESGNGGFAELEEFVQRHLGERERARGKLRSPLRSSLHVLERLLKNVEQRLELLTFDHERVERLDRELEEAVGHVAERAHRFATPLAELFAECRARGLRFYEREIRLSRVGLLKSSDRLQQRFQQDVLGDLEPRFDRLLGEAADWVIQEQLRLYERCQEALREHVRERTPKPDTESPALPGRLRPFEYRREEIVERVQEAWRQQVEVLDVEGESQRLMGEVKRGVRNQIGLTLAAVGVGAGTVALSASLWTALAGVGTALLVGGAGLVILPTLRRRATRRFSEKLDELAREVSSNFLAGIQREVEATCDRLRHGWEPFLAFHRAETRVANEQKQELTALEEDVRSLDRELENR